MNRITAAWFALLLCLAAPAAMAAQPSDAQVDKLLEVMRARQTVDAMLPQVAASQRQMAAQMTAGQPLTTEQQAKLDRLLDKSMASVGRAMSWDKLEPVYRDI